MNSVLPFNSPLAALRVIKSAQRAADKELGDILRNSKVPKVQAIKYRRQIHVHDEFFFSPSKMAEQIDEEARKGNVAFFTKRIFNMSEEIVKSAEILEGSQNLVDSVLVKYKKSSEDAIVEIKKRTSQLNDYTSRLATSLQNVNKILSDDRMARAVENAERITQALLILETLEKNGSLAKIMQSMTQGNRG